MEPNELHISNVKVFDSVDGRITGPVDVTVRGPVIASIAPAGAAALSGPAIDGTGKTLLPGLIDAHWHAMFTTIPAALAQVSEFGYVVARAVVSARETLLRGFTTVRDLGGPVFGVKQAIDEGSIPGPRIYPAGGFISQSGGHGDFRLPNEVPRGVCGHLSYTEIIGAAVIADGEAEVLRGAREMLRRGASQLKLMAGGGVTSAYDPLDVAQFTETEMRAAVEAAENWGTYVTVHAYTPRAIRAAIAAGVRCVEHGQLIDEPTAALLAEKDIWWCLQPFLDDEDAVAVPPPSVPKFKQMVAGTDTAYQLAIKHGVKIAFGTDTLFDAKLASRQGAQLAKLTRWFTPAEVLQQATIRNAELLAMSGPRNPYPGRLGVVAEGALADLILVDGDPIADISLIARPDETFTTIIKNGRVVKGAAS
ncbi:MULTISPECIES: metal-dependent hydrolase family protein [Mycobacterium ulcerans group]|uniref:Imidazolonepropionase n=3 Tax=Mycobacterium ulcerans group TaxID=2993898 RepID=B2HSF3_MYCMM|nr:MULTISPECIES: amidohydrolase family protein [Mycobacterium ulcerans group]ULL09569.1 amidohydrolase family protein [Mycobacterium liflandii]ABL03359.1 imidazolonepropionase [Mycobacterium ulcerans Agy99]ACC39411.1 imidazolonepropionase [Mycobacterium marinum M]AGC61087.1 imidazolonepropionase [Mycobacterium liflandii 128FXT]EPQ73711.1 Prolidase [Mycobacterium marinum MB2]